MTCSIIVPVYNMAPFVIRTLSSLAKQSYRDIEVIIVDDGSTDNSRKLIKKFIKSDPRFSYFYFENGGLGKARNLGLSLATGKFVAFLDADDWLEVDYLKDCKLIKSPNDVVVQNRLLHYESKTHVNNFSFNVKNYFTDINVSCTNKIYSMEFIEKFKFSEGVLYEDLAFHFSVIENGGRFLIGSSIYNVEKRNESSITSNITIRHLDLLDNIEACSDKIKGFDRKTTRDVENYAFKASLYLLSNLSKASIPTMHLYKKFTLPVVLHHRPLLRFFLSVSFFLPAVFWHLLAKIRRN